MTVLSYRGPGLTKGLLQFGLRQFGEVLQRMHNRKECEVSGGGNLFEFSEHYVGFEDAQLGDDCKAYYTCLSSLQTQLSSCKVW